MAKEYTFINRDLSWLSFNHRVLLEAADETVPLYSRIQFLSIFSSNLDEFFRVRMPSIYAFTSIMLILVAVFTSGKMAVYALMAVPFFMSIMFPTIFALGVRGLGEETKIASSLIIMSIVGGAVFPLFMGQISDSWGGRIQPGYLVPAVCFAVVLWFALKQKPTASDESITLSH